MCVNMYASMSVWKTAFQSVWLRLLWIASKARVDFKVEGEYSALYQPLPLKCICCSLVWLWGSADLKTRFAPGHWSAERSYVTVALIRGTIEIHMHLRTVHTALSPTLKQIDDTNLILSPHPRESQTFIDELPRAPNQWTLLDPVHDEIDTNVSWFVYQPLKRWVVCYVFSSLICIL